MDDNKRPLYLPFAGPAILEAPLINKGSAFTEEERIFLTLKAYFLTSLKPLKSKPSAPTINIKISVTISIATSTCVIFKTLTKRYTID